MQALTDVPGELTALLITAALQRDAELPPHCERGEGGTLEPRSPLPHEPVLADLGAGAQGRGIAEVSACDPTNCAHSSPTDPPSLSLKEDAPLSPPGPVPAPMPPSAGRESVLGLSQAARPRYFRVFRE